MKAPPDGPRLRELWIRRLDGQELSDDEETALAAAIRADPALKRELLLDEGMARLLGELERDEAADEAFAARFVALVEAERQSERTISALDQTLRRDGVAIVPRRPARPRFVLSAVAAGAAAAVLVVVVATRGHREESRARPPAVPTTTVPAPSAQTPTFVPPPPGPMHSVLAYSFEDGRARGEWSVAPVGQCPPTGRSRYCLQAKRNAAEGRNPHLVGVRLMRRPEGLFVQQPGTELAFDYWMGETVGAVAPAIHIWLYDRSQRAELFLPITNCQTGRWVRAVVRVEDFQPEHPRRGDRPAQPGDVIDFVLISTSWTRQEVLFIDNFEIRQPEPASNGGAP